MYRRIRSEHFGRASVCIWRSLYHAMLVHRFWEGPRAGISDTAWGSLRSFSSHPQWVWTYSSGACFANSPVAVTVKHCSAVLPEPTFRALLQEGVPIQILKDIISFLVLAHHGGCFADLDIVLLPRGLPRSHYMFVCEPVKKKGAHFSKFDVEYDIPSYARGSVNIGFMACPKGADFARLLAGKLLGFWQRWALRSQRGSVQKLWMHNTRRCRVALQQHGSQKHIYSPMAFSPLPMWLTSLTATGKVRFGYRVPTWDEMLHGSHAVNLWHRQWPSSLQRAVEAMVQSAPKPMRPRLWIGVDPRPPCPCNRRHVLRRHGPGRWRCAVCDRTDVGLGGPSQTAAARARAREVRRSKRRRPLCPYCGDDAAVTRHGQTRSGSARWRCRACNSDVSTETK